MTLADLLPWLATGFALAFAYPWARWLLDLPYAPGEIRSRQPVLVLALTVGLSLGALTWGMMLLSALSPSWLTFGASSGLALALSAAGWFVWQQRRRAQAISYAPPDGDRSLIGRTTALLIAGLAGLMLLNAALWPLLEDDAIALYGPTALRIATNGTLLVEADVRGAYDSYPPLVPLAFAYPHLAAGQPQEYAARFITAALAVSIAAAAYVLGRALYDRATGLLAALLLAATPILAHWASTGYTDLPAATYYTLAALFAWRLWQRPHAAYAVLTGLMAGLAVFTKNGAWLLVASLLGWVIYTYWHARIPVGARPASPAEGRPVSLRHILIAAGAFLLVAGPWYVHTVRVFGYLVPATGWTDQAVRDPLTLLAGLVTSFGHFAFSGAAIVIGLAAALWGLWRSRWRFDPRLALLLGFGGPFLVVWWWAFSYDYRFLLMVWALLCILAARGLLAIFARLPEPPRRTLGRALPLLAVIVAVPAALIAVDNKPELLRNPFMSDYERHLVQLGPRYDLALWLRDVAAPEDWILSTDYHILYHLQQTHPYATFRMSQAQDYVQQFDYWVIGPGIDPPDWADDATLRLLHEEGGYRVYAVLLPRVRQ